MEENEKRRSAFHLLGKSAFAPRRRRGGSAADPQSPAGASAASLASFPSLLLAAPTPESTPGKETVVPVPQSRQLRRGTRHPIPSASPGDGSQHSSAVGGGNRFPFFPLLLQIAHSVARGFQPPKTSAGTGGPGRLTGHAARRAAANHPRYYLQWL